MNVHQPAAVKMVQHAEAYAIKNKFSVFPLHGITKDLRCACGKPDCSSAGKHPTTGNGVKAATRDVRAINSMFKDGNNIGIATGEVSGFFVLDIDGQAGEDALAALEAEHGKLPDTRVHYTGNGRHLLFKWPGYRIKNSVKKLGDGLDVRGDGGYIVGAPSRHATGATYRVEDPDFPIADASVWLLEMIGQEPKAEKKRANLDRRPRSSRYLDTSTPESVWHALSFVDPLIYDDWIAIGMALHEGGHPLALWDEWSRNSSNYEPGCLRSALG